MKKPYRALFLDALQRADLEVKIPAGRSFRLPTPGCVPFDIDPVLPLIEDFFSSHAKEEATRASGFKLLAIEDFPPLAVPYPETWWEWHGDERSLPAPTTGPPGAWMRPKISERSPKAIVFGMHVRSFSKAELLAANAALPRDPDRARATMLEAFYESADMTMEMILYASAMEYLKPGGPVLVVLRALTQLNAKGVLMRTLWQNRDNEHFYGDPEKLPFELRQLSGLFAGVLFAMALLSCRNVERVTIEPPAALSKKRIRRGGLPLFRYHHLYIRVPGRKEYVDPEAVRRARSQEIPLGLHYVRGHFKTFTPEKPLLGKAVGRFYWPPFLRGRAEAGVVGKTYHESPGEDAKKSLTDIGDSAMTGTPRGE